DVHSSKGETVHCLVLHCALLNLRNGFRKLQKEIEALSEELPALEAYVDYLKHQAAKVNNRTNSTQMQQLVNSCLRDTAHHQQLALARVHSALSDFTSRQEKLIPFDNLIHLRKDKRQRLQTLLSIKPRMLRDARRFMGERTAFMDLSIPGAGRVEELKVFGAKSRVFLHLICIVGQDDGVELGSSTTGSVGV
ncbi:hypothetical protein PF001_g17501, partial [Phytophthora fragariae]